MPGTFCQDSAEIWQLVGNVITVLKIAIPVLIVLLAAIDLGKAVISSKEDEMKKATNSLIRRFIAGVLIFFLPTIVTVVFGLVDKGSTDGVICMDCISSPNDDSCTKYIK